MATEESRTGRGLKRGSGLARNQVRRRTFDLSTFVKCNLGGQSKWLQQLTEPPSSRQHQLHLECSCSVDSSLHFSAALLLLSLHPSFPLPLPAPLLHSSAIPAPPPDKAFSTLHCAAAGIREEIRKTPLEILLPWTSLLSTPLAVGSRDWRLIWLSLQIQMFVPL